MKAENAKALPVIGAVALSPHALAWHCWRSTPISPAGLLRFRLLPNSGYSQFLVLSIHLYAHIYL